MDAMKLYERFNRMLTGKARALSRKYPRLSSEEIQSEVYLAFAKAIARYDSNTASFSTFLTHALCSVDVWCWNQTLYAKTAPIGAVDESCFIAEDRAEDQVSFESEVDTLSPDAREIVRRASRGDFYDPERSTYKAGSRKEIGRILGWESSRFLSAWNEAKSWWSNFSLAGV